MSAGISCRIAHGKAVFKGASYEFRVFRVRGAWDRDAAITSGRRRPGTASTQHVGAHGSINGTIYSDTVEHEGGTFILLTSTRTRGASPVEEGAILLRLRPHAARIMVQGHLPATSENHYGDHVMMFEGNADILSVEEAELLGLRVPRGFVNRYFHAEEVEARFVVTELNAGVSEKPQFAAVSTATGVTVMELPAAPARRIRIRK